MTKALTVAFRSALRYAVASVKTLAKESGYSAPMFDEYANRRPPSKKAASALADALERRADRLYDYASKLREAVSHDPRGADS